MIRFYQLFLVLAAAILIAACSDRDPGQPLPPEAGDVYSGPYSSFELGDEASSLSADEIELSILAPDGTVIKRKAHHVRTGSHSVITMESGLKTGVYRLLSALYPNRGGSVEFIQEFPTAEFGLGSRIEVTEKGIAVIDSYEPVLGFCGSGTKESPFVVSSSSHLSKLMMIVNDYDLNRLITEETVFTQVCDIDMKQASLGCDMEYGWLPIGADTNTPFRGVYLGEGHKIRNLIIKRLHSSGIGLFGYLHNASVDGLVMSGCSVQGQFAVAAIAGAVVTGGSNDRGTATLTNCRVENCTVGGNETSAAIGGVLGATDMHSKALISSCTVEGGSFSGGMNVGGLMGGAGIYSSVMVSACRNSTPVASCYSGAGGIVGTADTLQLISCFNSGRVKGGTLYSGEKNLAAIGAGGIAGGTGMSWITASVNSADVDGFEGVGGIIGSTRVTGSESSGYQYNQCVIRSCGNTGNILGENFVGGAAGESQAGTYAVYNTGEIAGRRYVGGICGNTSVAVVHNSVNSGRVEGESYVSGIVGKTTWGSLALDQNMGEVVSSNGHAAGVLSLAGNNTVVHYCANFGNVSGPLSHPAGGIIGEIGDPREWTAMNIAECVIGSLECVMAVAGPVLAVVEEAAEGLKFVKVAIKLIETPVEIALQSSDYVLYSFGIKELISPEIEEKLEADIHSMAEEASGEVSAALGQLRSSCGGEIMNLDPAAISDTYMGNVERLREYYDVEGNDEKFNDAINEAREERAEKLEKVSEAKEIFHDVISGVAIAVGTVTFIAGEVVSGGAATPILVASSMAALVGGANAIVKTCTEFENNAVVVSQCVNAGNVSSPSNSHAASIAGKINDGCLIHDCLNTAGLDVGGNIFIGDYGKVCDMHNFISLIPAAFDTLYGLDNVVMCDPGQGEGKRDESGNRCLVAPGLMPEAEVFTRYKFKMGDDATWTVGEGMAFPVPARSLMQK